jgi:hypothetical protein
MSASFAKAVMPRVRRDEEIKQETDWSLGWILPERSEPPLHAEFESPHVVLRDAGSSTAGPFLPEDAVQKNVHD